MNTKLPDADVFKMREEHALTGCSQLSLARKYGVSGLQAHKILNYEARTNVPAGPYARARFLPTPKPGQEAKKAELEATIQEAREYISELEAELRDITGDLDTSPFALKVREVILAQDAARAQRQARAEAARSVTANLPVFDEKKMAEEMSKPRPVRPREEDPEPPATASPIKREAWRRREELRRKNEAAKKKGSGGDPQ